MCGQSCCAASRITPSADGNKSLFYSEGTVAAFQYWYDLMYKHFACSPTVPGSIGAGGSILVYWRCMRCCWHWPW